MRYQAVPTRIEPRREGQHRPRVEVRADWVSVVITCADRSVRRTATCPRPAARNPPHRPPRAATPGLCRGTRRRQGAASAPRPRENPPACPTNKLQPPSGESPPRPASAEGLVTPTWVQTPPGPSGDSPEAGPGPIPPPPPPPSPPPAPVAPGPATPRRWLPGLSPGSTDRVPAQGIVQPVTGGSKTPTTPIRAVLHALALVIVTSMIPAFAGFAATARRPGRSSGRPCSSPPRQTAPQHPQPGSWNASPWRSQAGSAPSP